MSGLAPTRAKFGFLAEAPGKALLARSLRGDLLVFVVRASYTNAPFVQQEHTQDVEPYYRAFGGFLAGWKSYPKRINAQNCCSIKIDQRKRFVPPISGALELLVVSCLVVWAFRGDFACHLGTRARGVTLMTHGRFLQFLQGASLVISVVVWDLRFGRASRF